MKKIIYTALLAIAIGSCSEKEEVTTVEENIVEGAGLAPSALKIDFTKPVVYYYADSTERDLIIENIIGDIYETDLRHHNEGEVIISDEVAVDMVMNDSTGTLTLYPDPISSVTVNTASVGDGEACSGKVGDGWKSYGTCMSKSCVKEKSSEAMAALSESLVTGKCIDLRIKRNAPNARVCARLINC
ncbi:hypothetical protein HYN48_10025 [Flavobacterium magnum]|uniref:Lipoprotein n=1 Tax=Flavobacterium magnum TaxID=2162713 RepID=A0A2S0RGN9_9FLAO|nr:hypothetical protein [Flavobacterium magnum]AWA30398.1 hypothetical protein HYN48_10025 [Flavobacterium magnum]